MKTFKQLQEVLSKDADAAAWIDDFVKSDDPKFAGKSAKKRKEMALAAYYANQKNESVETPEQEKARKELDLKLSKWKNQQRAAKALGEEYHVVANNSYYGDKQEPVKLSSHKTKEEADAALAKHKAASKTEGGNRSRWHKTVDDAGLKKHMNEDISIDEENLDELSNKLLNRYSKKAEKEAGKNFMAADRAQDRGNYDKAQAHMDKADKRASGVYRAQSKIKEESLDEISKDTLSSYAHKAFAQGNDLHYDLAHSKGDKATDAERQAIKDKISKRNAGVIKAAQKMKESTQVRHTVSAIVSDPRDENGSKMRKALSVLASSPDGAKKATHKHFTNKGYKVHSILVKPSITEDVNLDEAVDTVKRDEKGKVIAWSHEGDWEKSSTKNGGARGRGKAANLSDVARRKSEKLAKEEVELDEAVAAGPWHVHDTKTDKVHSTYSTHKKAINAMNKLNSQHDGYETPGGITQSKFAASAASYHKEEVENLDELSKNTLKSYVGKAVQSHGSNRVIANMAWDKSEEPGDLLDKLGHKSLKDSKKRSIGIAKAVDKLTKEEVEEFMQTEAYDQLDEVDKKTLGNYIAKAHDQLMKHTSSVNFKGGRGDKDAFAYAHDPVAVRKTANRTKGMDQAISKLTKEDTDTMLTFKELLDSISESKIDDLRDKLAIKRASQSAYDKDYKPASKSNVTTVKGHSYGAGSDEDGDEEDDNNKKLSKPAAPEVKRGRGRPSGSKSGARN